MVLAACAVTASAQERVQLNGKVVDKQSGEAVPYVHIYTQSLSHGTVTDESGRFAIMIKPTDTLVFSAIGFDKYLFAINQQDVRPLYEVTIEMNFKTYELAPVKVTAYKDLESLKRGILDLNVETPKKEVELKLPGVTYYTPTGEPKMTVRGPITALYNKFSKEAKEKKKLSAFKLDAQQYKILDDRYNVDVVKRITQLNDEGARRFMEWCKFEDDFILGATEYELTVAMLKCLDEFPKADTLK